MCLARAAEILSEDMFNNSYSDLFHGTFSQACQQRSVSLSLLTLVKMILVGTNEYSHEQGNQQAALSIAQLIKFNSMKHGWRSTDGSVGHSITTPLPLYLGLLMHVKTRRKEVVEKLCALGLSVSYVRVLRLSSVLANAVCERYEENGTVCPPNLRGKFSLLLLWTT